MYANESLGWVQRFSSEASLFAGSPNESRNYHFGFTTRTSRPAVASAESVSCIRFHLKGCAEPAYRLRTLEVQTCHRKMIALAGRSEVYPQPFLFACGCFFCFAQRAFAAAAILALPSGESFKKSFWGIEPN